MTKASTIHVVFYLNQHTYYNGEDFMEQEFSSETDLQSFVEELKKKYPDLVYTIQNKTN